MVGETGTGKTLLAKSIARMLNVPFAIVDATVFTEAGYGGRCGKHADRLRNPAIMTLRQPNAVASCISMRIDKIARKER